jgi:thioredoxin-related protein
MNIKKQISLTIVSLMAVTMLSAQDTAIDWLSFEQLEDSLAVKPKKVFINFYAEWCAYCARMDKAAFRNPNVVAKLNANYYAVKIDVETSETIIFDGQKFENKEFGKKRNAIHEIALLLASRKGVPFSLPAIVLLNESFQVTNRYFEYISPKKMLDVLQD